MAITPDIPLQDITPYFTDDGNIRVSVLRLDLLHPVVSGNKWFKLQENLAAAEAGGYDQLLTFGGAYSNHLVATAAAAAAAGLKSVGIVHGLHAREALTPTLIACLASGMQLHFAERQDYRRKTDPEWLAKLTERYGRSYIIPEGGASEAGRRGAERMAAYIPETATHICLSVGTGTSLTGLRNALPAHQIIIGFPAMKGGGYLAGEIRTNLMADKDDDWLLMDAYHFGGFAKCPPELIRFLRAFHRCTGIPLDMVYTAKMMWGIRDLLHKGFFPTGSDIVAIHTGGLQGNPPDLFPT